MLQSASIIQCDSLEDVPPSDRERKKVLPPCPHYHYYYYYYNYYEHYLYNYLFNCFNVVASGNVQTQRLPVLDIVISGLG